MNRDGKAPLVLVADDHEAGRMVVRDTLEHAGYAVVEAEDGTKAVALFESHRPELVLLDVVMPGMDGFEACAAIRRLPGGDTTPILILTGLDDVESIRRAFESGATDFASKPINFLVLGHRVRSMLRAKRTLDDLRRSESRLASAQRIARLGNWVRDPKSGSALWSDEMYRIFGVDPAAGPPTAEAWMALVHADDRATLSAAIAEAAAGRGGYSLDVRIVRRDRGVRFVHEQGEFAVDDDGAAHLAGTTQDITERKQTEDQIRFLAYYDGLTLLPNRLMFMERLETALGGARRLGGVFGILFLDLDRFKQINDTLGHSVGDRLLQEVAQRLRKCLRSGDIVARAETAGDGETVARLGGDEFIISLTGIARGEDAAKVALRILEALKEPFRLDGHETFIGGSIGISLYPHDGSDVETLLKNADAAMYHAKDAGRGNYQFYNQSMNAAALKRLSLENSLRKALERDELLLHFQPVLDASTGAIVGAEALVRWRHPELGLVPPGDFIPLAEETGLILPIGEWVLCRACAQARAWRDAGLGRLTMAVNISGRQFRQPGFARTVGAALKAAGLDPRALELEITESVLMRNASETVEALDALKEMGFRISVDDFGTGYSSLSYLTRFPIDVLKIDQSFVRDLATDPGDAAITAAIIAMAGSLNLSVIAEGVETEEQRDVLRRQGCRLMQGYLFSRPIPPEAFADLLKARMAADQVQPAR